MNEAIQAMLSAYSCKTLEEQLLALKEIMQEVALLGLWRAKFFEGAAFYGGTALRILYGLPRFSEDLEFSLLTPDAGFDIAPYEASLTRELQAFGFEITVAKNVKSVTSSRIASTFIKANTMTHQLKIRSPYKTHQGALIKVKLEVDTDPPQHFTTEVIQHFQPTPFSIRSFTLPCLFAGKLHACLCRPVRENIKGRDWYDFLWFVSRRLPVDLNHLQHRMAQTGDWDAAEVLTLARLQALLTRKVETLNVQRAKREVMPFVKNPSDLDAWTPELFAVAVQRITAN